MCIDCRSLPLLGRAALRAALTAFTRMNTANPYGTAARVEKISQGKAAAFALPDLYEIQANQTGSNYFYGYQGSTNRRPIPHSELRIPKWRITKRTQVLWSDNVLYCIK